MYAPEWVKSGLDTPIALARRLLIPSIQMEKYLHHWEQQKERVCSMRTSLNSNTSVSLQSILASLSISLALTACGGDTGSGLTAPILNLKADQIDFVYPRALTSAQDPGEQNVCPRSTFVLRLKASACNEYTDPMGYASLIQEGSISAPKELGKGFVFPDFDGTCTIQFKNIKAMKQNSVYILTKDKVPAGGVGNLQVTTRFRTGNFDASSCGSGTPFLPQNMQVGSQFKSFNPSNTSNFNNFNVVDPETGEYSWDYASATGQDLATVMGSSAASYLISSLFGVGSVPGGVQIRVTFNEDVDPFSARNGLALYPLVGLNPNAPVSFSNPPARLGNVIDLTTNCPLNPYFSTNGTNDYSCTQYADPSDKSVLLINPPGGYLSPGAYVLLIGKGMTSWSGNMSTNGHWMHWTVQ